MDTMEPMPPNETGTPPKETGTAPPPGALRSRRRGPAEAWVAWIVLIVGVLALGSNFGVVPYQIWDLWRLWPLVLVAVGVGHMARGGLADLVWGAAIAIYGAGATLTTTHIWSYNFWQAWPIFIIAAGVVMLGGRHAFGAGVFTPGGRCDRDSWERWTAQWGARSRRSRRRNRWWDAPPAAGFAAAAPSAEAASGDETWLDVRTMFGQIRRQIKNQSFRGGVVQCIFGGCILDLRAMPPPDHPITIHTEVVFGGVEIYLPPSWQVLLEGHGVFGAFQDETLPIGAAAGARPTLVVTGSAVFSAVTVK